MIKKDNRTAKFEILARQMVVDLNPFYADPDQDPGFEIHAVPDPMA